MIPVRDTSSVTSPSCMAGVRLIQSDGVHWLERASLRAFTTVTVLRRFGDTELDGELWMQQRPTVYSAGPSRLLSLERGVLWFKSVDRLVLTHKLDEGTRYNLLHNPYSVTTALLLCRMWRIFLCVRIRAASRFMAEIQILRAKILHELWQMLHFLCGWKYFVHFRYLYTLRRALILSTLCDRICLLLRTCIVVQKMC